MTRGKVFLVFIVFIVFIFFIWSFANCAPLSSCPWGRSEIDNKSKKVTLTMTGAWDDGEDWKEVFEAFKEYELQKRNLNVTIEYEKVDSNNYESILLDRQINGEGPNIFLIFNSWLPKYERRIVALPEGYMTLKEFESTFPKVVQDDFVSDGKIYSLPMYVDTLALYYNKEIFRNSGYAGAPSNWVEFANYVEGMTKKDAAGNIQIMGAAIGGGEKVNRSQDIVMALVMQNNTKTESRIENLFSFSTPEAQQAVKYYTDFANPSNRSYTWDYKNQLYSVDAFIQGKAAMSINYSYEIENIANKTSGNLDYGVAELPQLDKNKKINYASYWSPVVNMDAVCEKEDSSVKAECSDVAWDFVYFASQPENAELYLKKTGRPAANLALAKEQASETNSDLAPFASQVFTAESWDNYSSDKTDKALVDMIESVITTDTAKKKEIDKAVEAAMSAVLELN